MRELKFRAWDKLGKFYTGNGIGFENHNNRLKLTPTASSRFTIEQYTGLKDKKGVEIYEGDIILGEYEEFGTRTGKNHKFEVKFDKNNAGFSPFYFWDSEMETCFCIETCEVIGNIHTTPELLK